MAAAAVTDRRENSTSCILPRQRRLKVDSLDAKTGQESLPRRNCYFAQGAGLKRPGVYTYLVPRPG